MTSNHNPGDDDLAVLGTGLGPCVYNDPPINGHARHDSGRRHPRDGYVVAAIYGTSAAIAAATGWALITLARHLT